MPGVATRNELIIPPKVFSDYDGEAPRSLLVERKRREYATKLTQLPELIFECSTPGTLGNESSMLDLEQFDDDSYDIRTPLEWIQLATNNVSSSSLKNGEAKEDKVVKCRLPAVALCCTSYPRDKEDLVFEDVNVIGYNSEKMKFIIERKFELKKPTGEKEKQKSERLGILYDQILELPRLFVCFTVEDPLKFAQRVAKAHSSRYQSELSIRCQLYVDCMPTDGLFDLEQDTLSASRVLKLATVQSPNFNKKLIDNLNNGGGGSNEMLQNQAAIELQEDLLEKRKEYSHLLLKEASEDYARSMAAIVLRAQGSAHVPGFQELVGFGGQTVGGPPVPLASNMVASINGGKGGSSSSNNVICRPRPYDLPILDLQTMRANFDLVTSLNIPEAVDALQQASLTTFNVCRYRNFFLGRDARRSQNLSEFQDSQERHMDDEILALRQWPHDVCDASKFLLFALIYCMHVFFFPFFLSLFSFPFSFLSPFSFFFFFC